MTSAVTPGYLGPTARPTPILIPWDKVQTTALVTSVTFSGLPDQRGFWRVVLHTVKPVAGARFELRPNGDAANSRTLYGAVLGGANINYTTTALTIISDGGFGIAAGEPMFGDADFYNMAVGVRRAFATREGGSQLAGSTARYAARGSGFWDNTASALTSLVVTTNGGANNIPVGTVIALYFSPVVF